MSDPEVPEPTAASTTPEILLALQEVDTRADQLAHRRENSPLRDEVADAERVARAWEAKRDALRSRIEQLGAAIESDEQRGAELLAHRQRLERQMKTVIAPREAEALLHEMATIGEQTDELDTRELEALEEQAATDDQLSEHLGDEGPIRERSALADGALAAAVAEIDGELADLAVQRGELRPRVPDTLLATYDRKRGRSAFAVARLVGKQCQGCHLELSPPRLDTVKSEAAETGVTDCPDCGRLLIV